MCWGAYSCPVSLESPLGPSPQLCHASSSPPADGSGDHAQSPAKGSKPHLPGSEHVPPTQAGTWCQDTGQSWRGVGVLPGFAQHRSLIKFSSSCNCLNQPLHLPSPHCLPKPKPSASPYSPSCERNLEFSFTLSSDSPDTSSYQALPFLGL